MSRPWFITNLPRLLQFSDMLVASFSESPSLKMRSIFVALLCMCSLFCYAAQTPAERTEVFLSQVASGDSLVLNVCSKLGMPVGTEKMLPIATKPIQWS